jgi:PTH2 family peptidyl-tRNA hydrolase
MAHKLVLVVRTDLRMGRGKVAAQAAHAAVCAYRRAAETAAPAVRRWMDEGQPKIVVRADSAAQLCVLAAPCLRPPTADRRLPAAPPHARRHALARAAAQHSLPHVTIRDAGHTQVEAGAETVLAVGPGACPRRAPRAERRAPSHRALAHSQPSPAQWTR